MKKSIRMGLKKMLSCIVVMSAVVGTGMLTGCKDKASADLVVYGKIFTSE